MAAVASSPRLVPFHLLLSPFPHTTTGESERASVLREQRDPKCGRSVSPTATAVICLLPFRMSFPRAAWPRMRCMFKLISNYP